MAMSDVTLGRFFLLVSLFDIVACQVRVDRMSVSPLHPAVNGTATLRCETSLFDPSFHNVTWQRPTGPATLVVVFVSDRTFISPLLPVLGLTGAYFQTVIIKPLRKSDEGIYRCSVIEVGTGNRLAEGLANLLVSQIDEFPVCSPEGPAEVTLGETLSCRTVNASRTPLVQDSADPRSSILNWVDTSVGPSEPGSELQHRVTTEDDGRTFICFSVTDDPRQGLSCAIGPLTLAKLVGRNKTQTPCYGGELSPVSIACIAVTVCVLIFIMVINLLFCQYNPRQWRQLLQMCNRKKSAEEVNPVKNLYESSITGPTESAASIPGKCLPATGGHRVEVSSEPSLDQKDPPSQRRGPPSSPSIDRGEDASSVSANDADYELPANASKTEDTSQRITELPSAYMDLNLSDQKASDYTELQH